MHKSAMMFGKFFFETYCTNDFSGKTIVDVGAQDVNGSLREVCPEGSNYVGVDFIEGNGVDVVLTDPYQLPFGDESVDVIVCSSVFEHSEFFWLLFLECIRILRPDGLFYMNAPSNGKVHRYPIDSWRFYPDAGRSLANWARRNAYNCILLESFIGNRTGPIDGDGIWNDFVAVILKNESFEYLYPTRIQSSQVEVFCGYSSNWDSPFDLEIPNPDWRLIKENLDQISGLNQSLLERDGQIAGLSNTVLERDGQIAGLSNTVLEREGQIASLNQSLAQRDSQIAALNLALTEQHELHQQTLSHIWNSTSWRLTKPVRSIGINSKRLIRLIEIAPIAIKRGGGVRKAVGKALRIYGNEGIDGVRRALGSLRPIAPQTNVRPTDLPRDVSQVVAEIPRIIFDQTFNRFVEYKHNPTISPVVRLIAFYLPQFHPFPENDEWWGKGFTEWTNVCKAKPNFSGHYQPHFPIHSGYYDLRVPEVMEEQARLAKEYGIYGFSYYFYWFGGKILMDTPLEMMLANKNVDIPFCFTWANENWSRRWDGQEDDILIAQNHSEADSLAFIRHLIKYFHDDRYIRVEGKPLLIIYRANIIPDMAGTAKLWRDELLKHGFPGLYLVSAQTFGIRSPVPFAFDASVEFPPHTVISSDITSDIDVSNLDFCGHIYSYEQVAANAVVSKEPDYKLFRTAMLSWDNTPRKQNNSHIFDGFSLLRYKQWLSSIVSKVNSNKKYGPDEKIVFVNAWNEWAEGTHLEPDRKFGYGYLQTTYDVLCDYTSAIAKEKSNLFGFDKGSECALIVHVHYTELWSSISKYLAQSFRRKSFDLFVTVTSLEAFTTVLADFPLAHVEMVENRGRDVLPFIRMLNVISKFDYTAVCKIHTKRSIYRDDGDKIRDEILDALIGSRVQVDDMLTRFKGDHKLGMVVPSKYLIAHNDHNMTFDKERVQDIANHLNIDFRYSLFPAGSMFWFSPKSLAPLLKLDDCFFEIESGLADGTCAHAVERLFCQVVTSGGFSVEGCCESIRPEGA